VNIRIKFASSEKLFSEAKKMKHIAVIGGGVAGLTAGIYALRAGFDCTVFEKNSFIGGNLTGWDRRGYHIDNCMHWLTGTLEGTDLYKIWNDTDAVGSVPIVKNEAFYYSERFGHRLAMWRDPDRTLSDICDLSPADRREAERFINGVKRLAKVIDGGEKADYVRCLPVFATYGRMTVGDLSQRFKHVAVKYLFTDYLDYRLSALALLFAYSAFICGNADIPAYGSRAMAERMAARFLSLGGKLRTACEVRSVTVRSGKAESVITDGGEYPADVVICCCDPFVTFGKLIDGGYMPSSLSRMYRNGKTPVFSSIHAAFECDASPEIPHGVTVFDTRPLLIGETWISRLNVHDYSYEKQFAPYGKTVLQTMFFLTHEESLKWILMNKEDYRREKIRFGEEIRSRIAERYPSLSPSVKVLDVWTPATYGSYFNAYDGAYLGFAMTPQALTYRQKCAVPGLENVFLASQWQRSPGGLPQAALNGRDAVSAAEKYLVRKHFTVAAPSVAEYEA